jgi:TetR/AcrR family transcriptional regulator, transcriptional repressor for nem operon
MTDSDTPTRAAPRRGDKRTRLVAGAAELLHQQGVGPTTLAHVAEASGVPLGNIYYYFKTKDDLVRAVISTQVEQVDAMLAELGALPGPPDRLIGLVRRWDVMRDVVARYGCPFGALASELDRRDDGLDTEAAKPISRILDWIEQQFAQLGLAQPRDLAVTLFAGVQGGALLAAALRDPDIMTGQVRQLEDWIGAQVAASELDR